MILEEGKDIVEVRNPVCLCAVILLDKHAASRPIPRSSPGLIGPGKAERKIRTSRCKDGLAGLFKK
jgi:hypothetical protein